MTGRLVVVLAALVSGVWGECNHTFHLGLQEEFPSEPVDPGARFDLVPERCSPWDVAAVRNSTAARIGVHSTVRMGEVVGIFVGVAVLSALIAFSFHLVRQKVFRDSDSLDTAFDAGGKVTVGMTATTIVSQWTWSATLLQSSTVAASYGISGPFWYAAGATIHLLIFSVLSIQLKMKAPGAKTFLQVIRARFGAAAHVTYCAMAGFTNLVVTASLILAGCAVLESLVEGLPAVLAVVLFAVVIGGYTLIGGLGATFYVSYFNSAVIFIVIILVTSKVYYGDHPVLGSSERLYRMLVCTQSPEGNSQRSYLTFLSRGGFIFGVINIVGNFGTIFMDQSYWQSSVAAKPLQGVWGFILGGLTWFAIPFCLASTMGLTYLALSSAQGSPLLSSEDVSRGLVAPVVAQIVLGSTGEFAMIFLILMAVMSTGSAEVIAVVSVIIYDIYQVYVQPYREDIKSGECILCANHVRKEAGDASACQCRSGHNCEECKRDGEVRKDCKKFVKPHFTCPGHGNYREYLEKLQSYKNWGIVWVTLFLIPLFLACKGMNLNLNWVYLFTGVVISAGVVPTALSIMWARLNAKGMIAGAVGGSISGLASWLITASTYPGGLSNFLENTGQIFSMLVGNVVSLLTGALLCLTVTLLTSRPLTDKEIELEWDKTRNIDNPLNPWTNIYKKDLKIEESIYLVDRPSLQIMSEVFRRPRLIAYGCGVGLALLLVIIWPGIMASFDAFDLKVFTAWTTLARVWTYVAAIFIIVVPFVQEVLVIFRKIKENRKMDKSKENNYNMDKI